MKILLALLLSLALFGCADTNNDDVVIVSKELPVKEDISSHLASTSPIKASNLDDYLFRDDCVYIDTRDAKQFYSEGHVAGFTNIPFYGYITDFKYNPNTLFSSNKSSNGENSINFGHKGSYSPNYEESIKLIEDVIPRDKNILVISTAGVESAYFLNLLSQLGYDDSKLYNVGCFSNGMGEDVAYSRLEDVSYLVEGIELYDTNIQYILDIENYNAIN